MAGIISAIFTLLIFAIVIRSILSFVVPMAGSSPHPLLVTINTFINQITDPILTPIRRSLPSFGMLDLSPMVAVGLLLLIRWAIVSAIN